MYVRSRKAGKRVMAVLKRRYGKLQLTINATKSAVGSALGRKFFEFQPVGEPGKRGPARRDEPGAGDVQAADTGTDPATATVAYRVAENSRRCWHNSRMALHNVQRLLL